MNKETTKRAADTRGLDNNLAPVVGAAITTAMVQGGVRVKSLAKKTKIDVEALVYGLMARRSFTIEELVTIASVLGVNALELFEAPTFSCPAWCVVTREEHLTQLWDNGGQYDHQPEDRTVTDVSHTQDTQQCVVGLSVYTNAEGRTQQEAFAIGEMVFERAEAVKLVERLGHLVTLTSEVTR